MNDLYKDIMEVVNFELDLDEQKKAHKYCKNLRMMAGILTTLIVLLGVFAIYCIHADVRWGFYAFLVFAVLCIVISKTYKRKYAQRVVRLINDCSVNKGLAAHVAMASYVRKGEKGDTILSCIGSVLFYLGKMEECKKIADLLDKYCDTVIGNAYAISLRSMVALYEKDRETLGKCLNEFATIASQSSAQYITMAYDVIKRYPMILEAEENGDYANALELLKLDEKKEPVIKKVSANYRLYKVAKAAGMEAEASEHRSYVLQNGGDTFYKKELETAN